MKQRRDSRGFTMIEAMVAMAIFSVVVLGLTALLYAVIQGNQQSSTYTVLISLAKGRIENIQMMSLRGEFPAIGNVAPFRVNAQGVADANGKFTIQVAVQSFDIGILGNVDYKEVDVTATSLELIAGRRNRSVTLSDIVAPPVAP